MATLAIKDKLSPLITDAAQELIHFASLENILSWQDLVSTYQLLKDKHAAKKVLLLLEDIGQCEYTSMHASMQDGLYFDETDNYPADSSEADVHLENIRPLEVNYHIEQLLKLDNRVHFSELFNKFTYNLHDFNKLIEINQFPEKVLDKTIKVKLVDTSIEAHKFAAQLNGYFSCDLNPFESFSLIRHLDENYALEYIGLGASLLFFIKSKELSDNQINTLMQDLAQLYHFDEIVKEDLKQVFLEKESLIIPYSESLDVFM